MKFRRTVSSVVASVFLVVAVLLVVVQLRLATYGMNKVRSLIQSFLPSTRYSVIEIQADGMESTLMRSLKVNGIKASVMGEEVAEISSVEVSLTLWDVIKLALGKSAGRLDVTVNDVTVRLSDKAVDTLVNTFRTASASGSSSTDSAQTGNGGSSSGPLSDMGISLTVRNLCIYGSYKGFEAATEGINASAGLAAGLIFESAELNIPEIDVAGSSLGDGKAFVKDIRVSMGSDKVAYISVDSGSYADLARFSDMSAIASLGDNLIQAAVYVDRTNASIPVNEDNLDVSVNSTTVSVNYVPSDSTAVFSATIEEVDGSLGESWLDAALGQVELAGSFDGKEAISFRLGVDSLSADVSGAEIRSGGLQVEAGLVLGNLSSIGQLSLREAGAFFNNDSELRSVFAEGSTIDYSYSKQGLSVRLRSTAGGQHAGVVIGDFSADLDISAQTRDFRSVSAASVGIRNISMASLPDNTSVEMVLGDDGNIHAGLNIDGCLETSADYLMESGEFSLNVFITNLMPASFKALYDEYLASVSTFGEDTVLNGNIVISANATESFSDYVKALHEGQYPETGFGSLLDMLAGGRISINTAAGNLHMGSSTIGGAFTLESTVDGSLADISSLAVTVGGIRVSYSGSIELLQTIPEGLLLLQKTTDGSTLASLSFIYEQGERRHSFLFESPFAKDLSVTGSVNWNDLSRILVDGVLVAPFFPDDLDFNAIFTASPLSFNLQGDSLDLALSFGDGLLALQGNLDNLEISPKENTVIRASSLLDASYYTDGSGFAVNLKDLSVLVSDSFEVGFDLSVTDHSLSMTNLKLGIRGEDEIYYGDLDFLFSDIPSLLKLDTSSLDGTVDFIRSNNRTALRAAATDDQFSLQFDYIGPRTDSLRASLSVIGQRDNAIYASASLVWGRERDNSFSLNAIYDDRMLQVYDSGGTIGSIRFEDMNLVVDFAMLTLNGAMDFKNEKVFKTGETVTQSGKIGISASGQAFSDSLIQALTGQDYSIDFKMSFTDFVLSDGYALADSQVDMHLENGLLSFSGSLVNGAFDTASGYLELDINENSFFGFKAKGYIGDEMDLLLTDLRFPLPLMNQFMDVPNFSFTDGLIEGDVLITGPLSDPSLYGMIYCQSYEMSLFYLPDQTITVKNVALSINDHSLLVSRTPLAGYSEADGRYFFGDVSVDIILQGLGVETFDVSININDETPVDFWLPVSLDGDGEFEIRGDVSGYIDFAVNAGKPKLTTDITASSMLIDFRFDEEIPSWCYDKTQGPPAMDITLTTGHDVEFYYPEKDSPFINFTLAENRTARFIFEDGVIRTDGAMALKTGQVYYFRNDFIIKEGSVDLSERNLFGTESTLPVVLNLRAEITDYDSDGNKVIISMMLQNATLDNITPRFSSTPAKSENEILSMLGQSVLASGALDRTLSLSSLARFAATARETLTRVGVLESNKNYSITGIVRSSLGLDIFSARSNILANVIVDALPGEITGRADVSMLARYLDRTSLFAGKYIGNDWFVKVRLMLKADSNVRLSKNVGHFLAKDLILDTEISLDWDTPMGTLSVFTQPQELSVFDILDTIGFSVTRQIQY